MEIACHFFLIIAIALVAQGIGVLFNFFLGKGFHLPFLGRLFYNQVIGVFILVVGYALFVTQGKSVFVLLIIPIFYFWFYENAAKEKSDRKFTEEGIWWKSIIVLVSLISAFAYFQFIYGNGVHEDLFYYADASYYLNIYKQEKINIGVNVFDNTIQGCSPYHYAELWLNAIVNRVPNRLAVDNIVLVTFPYLLFLVFLGLLALSEETKRGWQIPLFAFVALFVFGVVPDFLIKIPGFQAINYLVFYPMNLPSMKALPICIGYLFVFLMLGGKDLSRSSIFYLSFIPFLSITTLPVIYGGSILFCIYKLMKGSRAYASTLIYTIVLLVGFYGFYYFTSAKFGENQSVKIDIDLNLISLLKNFFKVFLGIPFLMLIAYGGYFILLLLNRYSFSKFKNLILFTAILFIVGLGCWGGMYLNLNTSQIFTVTNLAFLHIFLAYLILRTPKVDNYLNSALIFIMTAANGFIFARSNNYFIPTGIHNDKMEFIAKIKNGLPKEMDKEFVVAYMKNPICYGKNFEEGVGAARGLYLHFIRNDVQLIGLNEPRAKLSDNVYDRRIQVFLLSQHPFYNQFKKENVKLNDLGAFQLEYLKRHNIQYLYLESNVPIPPEFKEIVQDSIVDKYSGDTFLILSKGIKNKDIEVF